MPLTLRGAQPMRQRLRSTARSVGCTVVERLEAMDAAKRIYICTIVSGPLPVANYCSTTNVGPDAKGSMIKWAGHYEAKGTPDAEAKKVIDGIYEAEQETLVGR